MSKGSWAAALSLGATAFAAHAGGGFATGAQEYVNFVTLGWLGWFSAFLAMIILAVTVREGQIMWNMHNCKSYKDLFTELFHPYDKLAYTFDIFYDIMILLVVASCIAGAAGTLKQYLGWNYTISAVGVGLVILLLSIFGAHIVRMGSSYMGIAILVTSLSIFFYGMVKGDNVLALMAQNFADKGFALAPKAVSTGFNYAAFQWVTIPGVLACGTILRSKKECTKAMYMMLLFNTLGLGLAVLMLYSWSAYIVSVKGGTVIPTLTALMGMKVSWAVLVYCIVLFLCLISSGVVVVFGFVNRFEHASFMQFISNTHMRRSFLAVLIMCISMSISFVGLTNIVKYGYGYCGYWAMVFVIAPLLTIGYKKNRAYMAEHGEDFDNQK